MSKAIWDTGHVMACFCAQHCDRCNKRAQCLQLMRVAAFALPINLCLECFSELQLRSAEILLEHAVLIRQEGHQG
jgi:hypothetical protein